MTGQPDIEVAELDEEVDEVLDGLRRRWGTLTGIDRHPETGDFVSIDLSATVDGREIPEVATANLTYQVGSGEMIEGIDAAITAVSAGESTTFVTKLIAGEYGGRDAEVVVKLISVRVHVLPELDDEFARMISEFDTIDELKAALRKQLMSAEKTQSVIQAT